MTRTAVKKRPTTRRTVMLAAGAAALVAGAGSVAAQSVDIRGTVTFAGGAIIPQGQLRIYLEDLAIKDAGLRRVAQTRIESDGRLKTMDFALSQPASDTPASRLQIVARLEREDGWLLARGSAQIKTIFPVQITLNDVIY